jgi:D-aminopeptidase
MNKQLRKLGITIGRLPPGPLNAITDVPGVGVGHVSVIEDQPNVVRSGITAITATPEPYWDRGVFAAIHRFNGFGELLGAHWIDETGILASPIFLTSTFSVGIVRDTMLSHPMGMGIEERFHQPVVAETNDGWLSDGRAQAVTREHVLAALDQATSGPVQEGNVGGGTGMVCFEFKSGIGTASRRINLCGEPFVVGVLVQANFGHRHDLTMGGVPVGTHIGGSVVPLVKGRSEGSIVIIVATDAPLLPVQCKRLAQRAVIGLARTGGYGANTSGDLILAFSTHNRIAPRASRPSTALTMMANSALNPAFQATAEATEEAILNSLVAAETMIGRDGRIAYQLPTELLVTLPSSVLGQQRDGDDVDHDKVRVPV